MKVDVTTQLSDIHGEVLKNPKDEPATVRWACCEALLANFQDESTLAGEEKLKRYELAKKIVAYDRVEISLEEAALIKKLVGKAFSPIVVGEVFSRLEKAAEPTA